MTNTRPTAPTPAISASARLQEVLADNTSRSI
jgi:hypothetical protein